jgi:putative oxidoreductase
MAAYARAKGVPQPELAVTLSAVPLLVGGASILLGVQAGIHGVAWFSGWSLPIMHDFWGDEDPQTRTNNMVMFMNLALAGGALALMGVEEPWEARVGKPTLSEKARKVVRQIAA